MKFGMEALFNQTRSDFDCAKRKVQSRRLNADASSLPRGVHMYAPAYTLCPMQGLAR